MGGAWHAFQLGSNCSIFFSVLCYDVEAFFKFNINGSIFLYCKVLFVAYWEEFFVCISVLKRTFCISGDSRFNSAWPKPGEGFTRINQYSCLWRILILRCRCLRNQLCLRVPATGCPGLPPLPAAPDLTPSSAWPGPLPDQVLWVRSRMEHLVSSIWFIWLPSS